MALEVVFVVATVVGVALKVAAAAAAAAAGSVPVPAAAVGVVALVGVEAGRGCMNDCFSFVKDWVRK